MGQFLIILRGAPASGKSSIAKSLSDIKNKIVWLKVDNFNPFFGEDASEYLDYVNGSALATLKYLLTNGFSVVMDGVFQNPNVIDEAFSIAKNMKIQAHAFELRCSLETLLQRDINREEVKKGYRRPTNIGVFKRIQQALVNNTSNNLKILNVDNKTLTECLEIISKNNQ